MAGLKFHVMPMRNPGIVTFNRSESIAMEPPRKETSGLVHVQSLLMKMSLMSLNFNH